MSFTRYLLVTLLIFPIFCVFSQVDYALLNAKSTNQLDSLKVISKKNKENKLIQYNVVEAENIMWSKMVWEYIDLKYKMNYPLYYPIDSTNVETTRRSLFINLLKGIRSGKITDIYEDSYFNMKLTLEEIEQKMIRIDTADSGFELLNQGETDISEHIDKISIQSQDIKGYFIRSMWYFDKKYAELRYRILALAPVAPDVQTLGKKQGIISENIPLFWVFYNSARQVLHDAKAFNPSNRASEISFDQIFNSRRFHTSIYREENIFDNRGINDYIKNNEFREKMESMRIKEEVRNREIDMWNY